MDKIGKQKVENKGSGLEMTVFGSVIYNVFMAESLGCDVGWNPDTKAIMITYGW